MKFDSIRLVPGDVHEKLTAGKVGVAGIQLCIGPGKIIAKYFVRRRDRSTSLTLHAPSLVVDP